MNKKPWDSGRLAVNANGRALVNGEEPFFWLGDTAWLMLKKLTLDEIDTYLENRKAKGYNVIQIMGIHVLPHTNAYGAEPFENMDVSRPKTDGEHGYWQVLDAAVSKMEALGMYAAIVPMWGTNLENGYLTEENAAGYAHFLASRYQNRPNIIWLVGGDILGNIGMPVWDAMGQVFKAECPNHLVTFHPFGSTSSSQWFHNRAWLDFNMFQSGHSTYAQIELRREEFIEKGRKLYAEDNWKFAVEDLAMLPPKPTIDGEPSYERVTKGLKQEGEDYWYAPDIRRFAYWSVLSGAMGFTYGHSAIMQFYKAQPDEGKAYNTADTWQQALHHPAAGQMQHMKALLEAVDYACAKAAPHLLKGGQQAGHGYIPVLEGEDFIYAYSFTADKISLDLTKCSVFNVQNAGAAQFGQDKIHVSWFCPVSGVYSPLGEYSPANLPDFEVPQRFDGSRDWVLVIRKADKAD